MQKDVHDVVIPGDLVLVGYVSGAYGLNGWVRIRPYATDASALLTARTWWLDRPELHDVTMLQSKMHSGDVVAQLMGVASRETAETFRGAAVHVSRAHFPALGDDEFYWVDLIGLEVENLQGDVLGQVVGLVDNGAQPVLRIAVRPAQVTLGPEAAGNDPGSGEGVGAGAVSSPDHPGTSARPGPAPEMLIPFVDQFVRAVSQSTKKVTVDWDRNY